jgi:uncharacterized protein involved in tellurium resistance
MPSPNVDIVFVLDASDSMKPCFDALRQHLNSILQPMQGYVNNVRFGLLAHFAAPHGGKAIYEHTFLGGQGPEMLPKLYGQGSAKDSDFFTTDGNAFSQKLGEVRLGANEEMLIALDTALDFPFGDLSNTKRVVAMFSDESLDDGLEKGKYNDKIAAIIEKIHARKIKLFTSMPGSDSLYELASADQSEIEEVTGGDGLGDVDFAKLLAQMGKSISGSSLQASAEPSYQKAIFGQDKWGTEGRIVDASVREQVLAVGESATLDTSKPINHINVKMNWTAAVDLDLHAFIKNTSGGFEHVFFHDKTWGDVALDYDAGVGDVAGHNEENINISSLRSIEKVLFGTKIFKKGGSFSDYDGNVVVSTNNGDEITVPLTAKEIADWCVIAMIDNSNPESPRVVNLNKVMLDEPDLNDFGQL